MDVWMFVDLTDGADSAVEMSAMASPRRSATCPPLFSMNHFPSDRQWAVRIRAHRSLTRLTTSAACFHGDAEKLSSSPQMFLIRKGLKATIKGD